ncbi:hypothetical protein [uncultured Ruegeria sp.]|uniref:hypothetical protein n=1 Tax=uncultured Ruegeria sp. TaxID=259304 RepID=UPI00261BF01E|nr:hypothetical protein [uncultured Ruegeria sp.]
MTDLELDFILTHRWPLVMRSVMAGTDQWLKDFVRSIARHGKRSTWRPSEKQEQIMKRLLSEMATSAAEDIDVIER